MQSHPPYSKTRSYLLRRQSSGSPAAAFLWLSSYSSQKAAGHIFLSCSGILRFCIFHVNAQTVCIRVCRQHQVCIHFLCQSKPPAQTLPQPPVRITLPLEIPVRKFLFLYYIDILKSKLFSAHAFAGIFPVPCSGEYTIFKSFPTSLIASQ